MLKLNLQLFGGRGSGGGKGGSGGSSNEVRLGDEVTFRGNQYIVIHSEGTQPDSMLTLRPVKHFDPSAFNDTRVGFYDVLLARYQLRR